LFCIRSGNKNMCGATSKLQWWHLEEVTCVEANKKTVVG